jgi:hypothetical protein
MTTEHRSIQRRNNLTYNKTAETRRSLHKTKKEEEMTTTKHRPKILQDPTNQVSLYKRTAKTRRNLHKKTEQKMTTTVKNSGRRQRRSRIDSRNKESRVQQTTKPTKTRRDFAEKNSTIQLLCASISIYQQKGKSSSILLLITCQSISSAFQYLLLPHTKSQI